MKNINFKQAWSSFTTGAPSETSNSTLDTNPKPEYTVDTKITVEDIVNSTGDKYPAYVMDLAKLLKNMKVTYSVQSSELAKTVFAGQDDLNLQAQDLDQIMSAVIQLKQSINDNVQSIVSALTK